MMSTSSSYVSGACASALVAVLDYPDIVSEHSSQGPRPGDAAGLTPQQDVQARLSLSQEELAVRVQHAVAEATQAMERRLRAEFEQRVETERARITAAVVGFQGERGEYYSQVEPELVRLILSVAGKILHREAQVDRMLVAALAKVAVENLQQRSHVALRVAPEACAEWREYFEAHLSGTKVEVLEDSELQSGGCVLETELGTAEIGIEAQLKEIERGFFDLLAKRPEPR